MASLAILFAALTACLVGVLVVLYSIAADAENSLLATYGIKVNVVVAIVGFVFTYYTAPLLREKFIKAGIFGIDLNKRSTKRSKDGSLLRHPETNRVQGVKVPEVCFALLAAAVA